MRNTFTGQLPRHFYVYVDTTHTHNEAIGFVPAVWFGLASYPGRSWGCTIMFESGAIYRNLPLHALAFDKNPEMNWSIKDAQTWDCYGLEWSACEYEYLQSLNCKVYTNKKQLLGEYMFSVSPIGDPYSAYPDQSKEFTFVKLINNRITVQPTNHIIFQELSFTNNPNMEFPKGLKRQNDIWSAEDWA